MSEAPDVAEDRAFLGSSYVEVGRFADAHSAPRGGAPPRRDPADARTAIWGRRSWRLRSAGRRARRTSARRGARAARRGDPLQSWQRAGSASRAAEAAAAYERALAINPEFATAHVNYGSCSSPAAG